MNRDRARSWWSKNVGSAALGSWRDVEELKREMDDLKRRVSELEAK